MNFFQFAKRETCSLPQPFEKIICSQVMKTDSLSEKKEETSKNSGINVQNEMSKSFLSLAKKESGPLTLPTRNVQSRQEFQDSNMEFNGKNEINIDDCLLELNNYFRELKNWGDQKSGQLEDLIKEIEEWSNQLNEFSNQIHEIE